MEGVSLSRYSRLAVGASWVALLVSFGTELAFDLRLAQIGRDDLSDLRSPENIPFVAAILGSAVVGSALVVRRPGHPVGWLFLALALALSLPLDIYTSYAVEARPGELPATGFIATLADISFIPMIALLAFVILLTPSGRLESRASRLAAWAAGTGGAVALAAGFFRPYRGDFADRGIQNPLAPEGLAGILNTTGVVALVVLHIGLLMGVALLLLKFRRRGGSSQALRWLAFALIPFPLLVVGAWVAAATNNQVLLALAGGGFAAIIPIAAGLAIEKDHLYDIDRLLSRGLTYSLLTGGLVGCYAVTVLVVGQAVGGNSQVAAVVATLLTVSLALPARRRLQQALDRRFNRRQFEAVSAIAQFVREPSPSTTIEQALRSALGDESLSVAYWIEERECWVDELGKPATPGRNAFDVERRGERVAAVELDRDRTDRRTVEAVLAEALPEIENARLRAAIALQLVEVRESRARIVAAQVAERKKLERNLHDGAQQRLLAIALQLRAAEVGDDPMAMRTTLDEAVHQLQLAVGDLRELANGFHPSVLADGGLAAALDDLAARTPVAVRLNVTGERFSAPVEEAAWYVACEAVTNAVKHAAPKLIDIAACRHEDRLQLTVEDDGCGGADPLGNGLRGIADRAEAAGGWLTVRTRSGAGTVVTAELPCGS
jgi:signal transduction histidine kinase